MFDFRDEVVFSHFAARKGNLYKPTGNDRRALKRVREAGYSLQQITAAIEETFDRGDSPTTFAYCARIVEDCAPARRLPALLVVPVTPAAPATPGTPATPATPATPITPTTSATSIAAGTSATSIAAGTSATSIAAGTTVISAPPAVLPEEIKTLANMIAPHLQKRAPSTLPPSGVAGQAPSALPTSGIAGQASSALSPSGIAELASSLSMPVEQARRDLGYRLKALADLCDEAARQHGATGADWLRDALQRNIGKDDPLAYTAAILRAWAEHGPAADFRPTRDGYHPPRRAPAASPANSAGANGDDGDPDPYRVLDPPLLPLPEK